MSPSWGRPNASAVAGSIDARDDLQLDEVVAGAERAELAAAAKPRALGDGGRVGAWQAAAGLRALHVLVGPDPQPEQRRRAVLQHSVQAGVVELERAALAHAGGDRPRELVHERLHPGADLVHGEWEHEQAHAAVDVVADSAGRDDAVRDPVAATPPTGKP